MLRTLFVIAYLVTASPVLAQAAASSPTALADSFFKTLQTGDATKAYDQIFSSALRTQKAAEVQNLSAQTDIALKYYGKISGWELVREKTISPSFVDRVYLVRAANGPIFYRMQFYKADQTWSLVNIYFNDTYDKIPGA